MSAFRKSTPTTVGGDNGSEVDVEVAVVAVVASGTRDVDVGEADGCRPGAQAVTSRVTTSHQQQSGSLVSPELIDPG